MTALGRQHSARGGLESNFGGERRAKVTEEERAMDNNVPPRMISFSLSGSATSCSAAAPFHPFDAFPFLFCSLVGQGNVRGRRPWPAKSRGLLARPRQRNQNKKFGEDVLTVSKFLIFALIPVI